MIALAILGILVVLVPIVFAAALAITAKVNILGGWGGLSRPPNR